MAKKNTPVLCLEKTLQCWEEHSALLEAYALFNKATKTTEEDAVFPKRWREYRKEVLRGDIESVRKEFVPQDDHLFYGAMYGQLLADFPEDLMWWCHSSRRVFNITRDLELLLKNTKLGNVRWSDVELPFSSFLLTLEDGIEGEDMSSSVFLVTTKPERGCPMDYVSEQENPEDYVVLKVTCFSDGSWENYEPQSSLKRDRMLKQSAAGKSGFLRQATEKFNREIDGQDHPNAARLHVPIGTLNKGELGESIISILSKGDTSNNGMSSMLEAKEESPKTFAVFDQVLSLIAGLCLYLKTLTPAQTEANVTHEKQPKTSELSSVTEEAEICTVQSVWKLSDAERTAFTGATGKGSGHEMPTHFRRGTWRRNKGSGNNPDAPRCIWVRPTIVRPDRLAEGSLPQGALTSVC